MGSIMQRKPVTNSLRNRVLVVEDDGWIRRFMRDLLTDEGYEKLRSAAPAHVGSIREIFGEHFSSDELETLRELLGRLPADPAAADCEP